MRAQDPGDGAPGRDAGEGATETEAPSTSRSLPALPATFLGWLVAPSIPGGLFVDFPGNVLGPVTARSALVLDEAMVTRAVAIRQPAILVFENGEACRPIVLGLLQAPPSPLEDLLLAAPPARPAKSVIPERRPVEARVDGRRVTVSADEEITLKCGEASLTLRRDGKILLRGAYVETYARGTNRIKGAQVKIN
jgi:hypothetical protein